MAASQNSIASRLKTRSRHQRKSEGQLAFEALEQLDDSSDNRRFAFKRGSLVHIQSSNATAWQLMYPILILDRPTKFSALQNNQQPQWVVHHINPLETIAKWQVNNKAAPIAADIPNSDNGGQGVVFEHEIVLLIENPTDNIEKTQNMIIQCMQHALIQLGNEITNNKTQRAAQQILFDAGMNMYKCLAKEQRGNHFVTIGLTDLLIEPLSEYFESKKEKLLKNKNEVYSWEGSLMQFKNLVPATYLFYRQGDRRYVPIDIALSWNKTRSSNSNLKIQFRVAIIDNNGNFIVTAPTAIDKTKTRDNN